MNKAYFGGGCFWCTEAVFQRVKGVKTVISGYAGGKIDYPTYQQVSSGHSGHAEVVELTYDPTAISYQQLLSIFFAVHDPTTPNRQGNDVGSQYRSVIFYTDDNQKQQAREYVSNEASKLWDDPIVTELSPLDHFFIAEDYHQDYYNQNSQAGYCQAIINPKLAKLTASFADLLKQ